MPLEIYKMAQTPSYWRRAWHWLMSPGSQFLTGGIATGLSRLVPIAAVIILAVSAHELLPSAILVQPITVPKQLHDAGLTPEVAAQRVMDSIRGIQKSAAHSSAADVEAAWKVRDVKLPGVELTVRTLLGPVKALIAALRDIEISGEITIVNAKPNLVAEQEIAIRLRSNFSNTGRIAPESARIRELDNLVSRAVEPLLGEFQPIVLASALFSRNAEAADDEIRDIKRRCARGSRQHCLSAHHLAGLRAYQCMDYGRALAEFELVLREVNWLSDSHWKAVVWKNKGNVLRRLARYEEAIEAYLIALEHDHSLTTARTNIGTAYAAWAEEQGDPPNGARVVAALAHLKLAQRSRKSADPDFRLGEVHRKLKRDEIGARRHFEAAREILRTHRSNDDERDIDTPARLTRAFRSLGDNVDPTKSATELATYLQSHPQRVDLTLDYAELLAAFGRWHEAAAHYRVVATKAPYHWGALENWAHTENALGNTREARWLLAKARSLKAEHQHPKIEPLAKGEHNPLNRCYEPLETAALREPPSEN